MVITVVPAIPANRMLDVLFMGALLSFFFEMQITYPYPLAVAQSGIVYARIGKYPVMGIFFPVKQHFLRVVKVSG